MEVEDFSLPEAGIETVPLREASATARDYVGKTMSGRLKPDDLVDKEAMMQQATPSGLRQDKEAWPMVLKKMW